MDRTFTEPHSIARFCGLFPKSLDDNILGVLSHLDNQDSSAQPPPKFLVDVSSRELLYALAAYYGFQFQIPGEPEGFIPAGTSLLWELHVADDSNSTAFVTAYFYYPKSSGRHVLRMGDCPERCPLDRFLHIRKRWMDAVGDFEHLCPIKKVKHVSKKLEKLRLKKMKKELKQVKKTERALVNAANSYVKVAQHSCPNRSWDTDEHVVLTFCQACRDFGERCLAEGTAHPALAASHGEGALMASRSGSSTTAQEYAIWILAIASGVIGGAACSRGSWLVIRRRETHPGAHSAYHLLA